MVCTHPISANPHRRDFQKSEKSAYALTSENQGTLGLYLALDCKCAFGAKSGGGLGTHVRSGASAQGDKSGGGLGRDPCQVQVRKEIKAEAD